MTNDLIRRGALLEEFGEEPLVWDSRDREDVQMRNDWLDYTKLVKEAPAVDAVEVVRCKDCAVPHNRWTGCPNLNGLIPPDDFFCARGERKVDHAD